MKNPNTKAYQFKLFQNDLDRDGIISYIRPQQTEKGLKFFELIVNFQIIAQRKSRRSLKRLMIKKYKPQNELFQQL